MIRTQRFFLTSALLTAISFTAVSAQAVTTILDASRDDATSQQSPDFNFGIQAAVNSGQLPDGFNNRFLVGFDLSSIPSGSIITSATLSVVGTFNNGGAATTISAHRMLQDWVEGTVFDDPNGMDHNTYDGTNTWGAPGLLAGTDYVALASGSATDGFTQPGAGRNDVSFSDMTADVQGWLDSSFTNAGWVLINSDEGGTAHPKQFWTREETGANTNGEGGAPRLTIEYTPIPEPASLALVGLGGLLVLGRQCRRNA